MNRNFIAVRKKPIVVYAAQQNEDFEVETLEGIMKGKAGDWLMRGIKNEQYPCAKEVFDLTYEIVEGIHVRGQIGEGEKEEESH